MQYAGFELEEVKKVIKEVAASIWALDTVFYNFTDHGIGHSNRVLRNFYRLSAFLPQQDSLNDLEIFSIEAAAYLHDIGMQWHRVCAAKRDPEDWETARLKHVSRGLLLIDHLTGNKPLPKSICKYPVIMQNFGNKSVTGADTERLLSWIKPIVASHSKAEDNTERGWTQMLRWADRPLPIRFRCRLLCSLFRLSDELDVTFERIPDHHRLNEALIPGDSLRHWLACTFVEEIEIENHKFCLLINKNKLPQEGTARQLSYIILDELTAKLNASFASPISLAHKETIKDILAHYQLLLNYGESKYVGGEPCGEKPLSILKKMLNKVQKPIKIPTDISYHIYEIKGSRITSDVPREHTLKQIAFVDETEKHEVALDMKVAFAKKLLLDKCQMDVSFLSRHPDHASYEPNDGLIFELTSLTHEGILRKLPITPSMASISHLREMKEIHILARNNEKQTDIFASFQPNENVCITLSKSAPTKLPKFDNLTIYRHKHRKGWIPVDFASPLNYASNRRHKPIIRGYFANIGGFHLLIPVWDNLDVPGIADFFYVHSSYKFRPVWNKRARLLEIIGEYINKPRSVNFFLTVSILGYDDRFQVMTYSTERSIVVSLSGAAIMSAGRFILDNKTGLAERFYFFTPTPKSVEIAPWISSSHLFLVESEGATIRLNGRALRIEEVKRLKEV